MTSSGVLRCYICNRDIPWDLAVYDTSPNRDRLPPQSQIPATSVSRGERRNNSSGGASFARKLFAQQQPSRRPAQRIRRNTCDGVDKSTPSISTNSYRRGVTVDDCIISTTAAATESYPHSGGDASAKLLLLMCDVLRLLAIDRCGATEQDRRHSVASKLCRVLQSATDESTAGAGSDSDCGLYYCDTLVNPTRVSPAPSLQTSNTLR